MFSQTKKWASGGTGIRAGLKILYSQEYESSILSSPTKIPRIFRGILFYPPPIPKNQKKCYHLAINYDSNSSRGHGSGNW